MCTGGQGCCLEGPGQAGVMGQQGVNEIWKGQMQSPAVGLENPLQQSRVGTGWSRSILLQRICRLESQNLRIILTEETLKLIVPLDTGSKRSHQHPGLFKEIEGSDLTPSTQHTPNPASTFVPHSTRKTSIIRREFTSQPRFAFETKSVYMQCICLFRKI